jgi:hypothetical protein
MVLTQQQKNELYKQIVTKAKRDALKKTTTKVLRPIGRAGEKLVSSTDRKLKEVSKSNVGESVGKSFKGATKAYKPTKKLSATLLAYGSSGGSRRVQAGPGRPAGVMKWRSPFNGQPIPATEYYKQVRAFRRLQTQKAEQVELQRQVQFARQGVQPRQIPNVIQERMRQQFLQQQMQRQMPQQVPNQMRPQVQSQLTPEQIRILEAQRGTAVRPIWRRQPVIGQENGKTKIYGVPQSFWN